MPRRISLFSLLVPDYDDALEFFCKIGFDCLEDTDLGNGKRWVKIGLPGTETGILLARAVGETQVAAIGNQGGGRVWLFLESDDFQTDYDRLQAAGVEFLETPRDEPYGKVVVWKDPWNNKWDLVQFKNN